MSIFKWGLSILWLYVHSQVRPQYTRWALSSEALVYYMSILKWGLSILHEHYQVRPHYTMSILKWGPQYTRWALSNEASIYYMTIWALSNEASVYYMSILMCVLSPISPNINIKCSFSLLKYCIKFQCYVA